MSQPVASWNSTSDEAELVLEALEVERIDGAIWQKTRHQKERQAARRLGQYQEGVRHRCGHEPLVPSDRVEALGVAHGLCRVGADISAALFLGHSHADGHAGLVDGGFEALVIGA